MQGPKPSQTQTDTPSTPEQSWPPLYEDTQATNEWNIYKIDATNDPQHGQLW
jgi:hypothetical protein